jgi:hypothetical protein
MFNNPDLLPHLFQKSFYISLSFVNRDSIIADYSMSYDLELFTARAIAWSSIEWLSLYRVRGTKV